MPEAEPADTAIPRDIQRRATEIVEKAIKHRGKVASLPSSIGNIRGFEDTISEGIWEKWMNTALEIVDDERWYEAKQVATDQAIRETIDTLMNQRDA